MQLGRKLADGYAADPELDVLAPPVVEVSVPIPAQQALDDTALTPSKTEPVRA